MASSPIRAGAAAVLSVAVPVALERLTAFRAGKGIKGFPVHLIEMGVPPPVAAGVRAELPFLPTGLLLELCSTLEAVRSGGRFSRVPRQAVPAAEGFDGVDIDAELLSDLRIARPITAHPYDCTFLSWRH